MADEAPGADKPEQPDGVFGNLPASRPGSRSPRRDRNGAEAQGRPPSPPPEKRPPPPPPPPAPEAPLPEPPMGTEREAPVSAAGGDQQISSIEDLAWAGIAVAAEAATVGVRFASRALDAARKSIDRE